MNEANGSNTLGRNRIHDEHSPELDRAWILKAYAISGIEDFPWSPLSP